MIMKLFGNSLDKGRETTIDIPDCLIADKRLKELDTQATQFWKPSGITSTYVAIGLHLPSIILRGMKSLEQLPTNYITFPVSPRQQLVIENADKSRITYGNYLCRVETKDTDNPNAKPFVLTQFSIQWPDQTKTQLKIGFMDYHPYAQSIALGIAMHYNRVSTDFATIDFDKWDTEKHDLTDKTYNLLEWAECLHGSRNRTPKSLSFLADLAQCLSDNETALSLN